MPNIDFYAAGTDFDTLLQYVFGKSGCRVFESCSLPGTEIVEFKSPGDISKHYTVGKCQGNSHSALLELVPPSVPELFHIRRVHLDPTTCDGHMFRYEIKGWGLIQLYLGGIGPAGLVNSHSNHNSAARAKRWMTTSPELGEVDDWDWREVRAISSALNRFIRTNAIYKLATRPVLPGAASLFSTGIDPSEKAFKPPARMQH